MLSSALVRWTPRLPRLQNLELWDGKSLEDEMVHASINQYCTNFNSLMIYTWSPQDSQERDHKFSRFISALRPNTLQLLHTMNDIGAATEAFLALNLHGKSLEDLSLFVTNESLPQLSLLQECVALRALRIEDTHGAIDLETTQNDVFLETTSWLRKCHNLQRLGFTKLQSGAAIATSVLLEENIKLSSLEIDSYILKDHRAFHQALVHHQGSLRYLNLSGDTDGMFRDDLDILVDSLKRLHELRDLRLILPEVLRDEHLVSIIGNLTLLEDLYVSGLELNDIVLDTLATLSNLRSVALSGISKFTMEGLLDFVSRLGPGNAGIRITIDMADPDTLLSDESVNVIRECLVEITGGTLEYQPLRGMRSDLKCIHITNQEQIQTSPSLKETQTEVLHA